jgi:hypothetical protein
MKKNETSFERMEFEGDIQFVRQIEYHPRERQKAAYWAAGQIAICIMFGLPVRYQDTHVSDKHVMSVKPAIQATELSSWSKYRAFIERELLLEVSGSVAMGIYNAPQIPLIEYFTSDAFFEDFKHENNFGSFWKKLVAFGEKCFGSNIEIRRLLVGNLANFVVLRCFQLFSDKEVWQLIEYFAKELPCWDSLLEDSIHNLAPSPKELEQLKTKFRDFHLGIFFPFDYYIETKIGTNNE